MFQILQIAQDDPLHQRKLNILHLEEKIWVIFHRVC